MSALRVIWHDPVEEPPPPPPEPPREVRDNLTTLADVLEWYEDRVVHGLKKVSPVALKERQRIWRTFKEWPDPADPERRYGDRPLERCEPTDLERFISSRPGLKKANSWRRWNTAIQGPFNKAAKVRKTLFNPFRGVELPRGAEGRDWTDREYQRLLRVASPPFRRVLVFIRFSGARQEMVRNTEWGDVNFEAGAIIKAQHKTAAATGQPIRIAFNSVLVKLLAWIRRQQHPGTRFVFLNSCNRKWSCQTLSKAMRTARERAGLPPDVCLHGGRHAFACRAVMNGVDVATLMELLNHQSLRQTQRYLHLAGKRDHLNRAMERAVGKKVKGQS